ncbi:MAG: hypothetical protein HXX08_13860 [Chloroflexi bacterium]|uniref:AAA family ATPase n=1 Tax=Candidatus Chlorohelix allophototropha TaxID=3003348 RepID=A0A8T7M4G9_9CHLR|nr:hypothetical protein [Chloroflexota bacterium]WJW70061.1 AAA family ATPase [Chloroflexota bacterium L227-S17]
MTEPLPSKATLLVQLLEDNGAEFFHDTDGKNYFSEFKNGRMETLLLSANRFKRFLTGIYSESYKSVPSSSVIQDALTHLEYKAQMGPCKSVYIRVARVQRETDIFIYCDLANEERDVVEISATGWQIIKDPPVHFIRKDGLEALPKPERGGNLDTLQNFINIAPKDLVLIKGWLLGTVSGQGPYPILVLVGEQGSGKTFTSRILRSLVDPSKALTRILSRDIRALMIAASNSHILSYDNVSSISMGFSDAFCSLATGIGFSDRTLYTNEDETIFQATRPILINGIDISRRPDFQDRSITIECPRLVEKNRKTEEEILEEFYQEQPKLLGALCDSVAVALENLPKTRLDVLPRMADFAKWVAAASSKIETNGANFLETYKANREAGNTQILETTLPSVITKWFDGKRTWEGTATELLKELRNANMEDGNDKIKLPADGAHLSREISRLIPSLRLADPPIYITKARNRKGSNMRISNSEEEQLDQEVQLIFGQGEMEYL